MRHFTRFESVDGAFVLLLPMRRVEQEESQAARTALGRPPLVDYGIDTQGGARVVADIAEIRHRAVLLSPESDDELDALRALLRRIGRGRLWLKLSDGTERWAWARATDLGSYQVASAQPIETGITVGFVRLSDWFAAIESEMVASITESPTDIVVTTSGLIPTRHVTVEIEATAADGVVDPTFENRSSVTSFTAQVASSAIGQTVTVDVLAARARRWDGQEVTLIPGGNQAELWRLEPGTQTVRITGVTSGILRLRWRDAYP